MLHTRTMARLAAALLGVAIAFTALSIASSQSSPPAIIYGRDANPGDQITAYIDGTQVDSSVVDAGGEWSVEVERGREGDVQLRINGASVNPTFTDQGQGLIQATFNGDVDDSMEGDSMESDELEGDSMEGDSMEGDDGDMMDDDASGLPSTGTGGLAHEGGVSAGLLGLLVALSAAAVAGIGIRRVRNRA